jgi:hypothetical protein
MRPLGWILCCAAWVCVGCVNTREWVVIQFYWAEGIGIVEPGRRAVVFVDGCHDPGAAWGGLVLRPRWRIGRYPPEGTRYHQWAKVVSGDLSRDGLVALARRNTGSRTKGTITQINSIRDGTTVAEIANCPLALKWSNDDSTLAILEAVGDPFYEDETRLVIWQRGKGIIRSWDLGTEFKPSYHYPPGKTLGNRFVVSWSVGDSLIAVSARKAPNNNMPPRACIVSLRDGLVWSARASDMHFVGADCLVYNLYEFDAGAPSGERFGFSKQWTNRGVFLGRWSNGQLKETGKRFGRAVACAAADASSGVFVAWHPPLFYDIKTWTLPMVMFDANGNLAPAAYGI